MVSANRLKDRRSAFGASEWIMDSGAFTTVTTFGGYPEPPEEYADRVLRWKSCGHLLRAVSQDFMCEEFALSATGLTLEDHQQLTVERYQRLRDLCGADLIMPVLQGESPADYAHCINSYGPLLPTGTWAGVGSLCRSNGSPGEVEAILLEIHRRRPDLKLHGFGLGVRVALAQDLTLTTTDPLRRIRTRRTPWGLAEAASRLLPPIR